MMYIRRYNYLRLYGYPVFAVFLYLILILLNSDESNLQGWKFYTIIDFITEGLFCLIFTIVLFESGLWVSQILHNKTISKKNSMPRFIFQLVVHIIIVSILVVLFFNIDLPLKYGYDDLLLRRTLIIGLIFSILITTGLTAEQLFLKWNESKLEAIENKKQALQSELNALKLQLDPHFLFNNLSTLTSLIEENQITAVQYVTNLSAVYRYVLSNRNKNLIVLKTELDFIKEYLFLYQIRYGSSIIIDIADTDTLDHLNKFIAPLTLQLLIENAIKHNSFSRTAPLLIRIYYEEHWIIVQNNKLPKFTKEPSEGIGLAHIDHSYRLLGSILPEVYDLENSFEVKVPLLNN
ncbi:Histidine kinase [Flavobacterium sp. CF108]|uniref:sensor histidine kinase n=1 Tax=unclassified Flavobacterium TaxID=196869 RepID=UPI0008BCE21D|nr:MULTISPECIES: histidine kinase [unclassified Flavobacterium]SEO21208.1 Histidine kinase [Flavobacterium sp. fv08]SHG51857.1 Histidine kinase [Flavobacterium sp. CF108]